MLLVRKLSTKDIVVRPLFIIRQNLDAVSFEFIRKNKISWKLQFFLTQINICLKHHGSIRLSVVFYIFPYS